MSCLDVYFWTMSVLFLLFCLYPTGELVDPPGHLQPLGSHRPPIEVEVRETVPDPIEMYHKYIVPSMPVVFKGAAKNFSNFEKWKSDEYLKENFGDWWALVDVGKYEGSVFGHSVEMPFREFIDDYKKKEYYLIQRLAAKNPMRRDISLLKCMACGGLTDVISDVMLLYSSGATKSALHSDDVENLHCVFDGTKEWVLFNEKDRDRIPKMEDDRYKAYGAVDCRSVDMYKYSVIQDLPWYHAYLNAGDCLLLPSGWPHHVKSEGNDRNLALAIWFGPITYMNESDCPQDLSTLPDFVPLGEKMVTPKVRAKYMLLGFLEGQDKVSKEVFVKESSPFPFNESDVFTIFKLLDLDNDGFFSVEEAFNVNDEVIERVEHFQVEETRYFEVQKDGTIRDEL